MANETIAMMIAGGLQAGLVHPGSENEKSMTLGLPAFRTAGMPEQVRTQVELTVKLIGEAIVHLIETDGHSEIVDKDELAQLRRTNDRATGVDRGPQIIPVHCRCDNAFTDPLMLLTIDGSPHVVIDGRPLIQGLSYRSAECPHEVKP